MRVQVEQARQDVLVIGELHDLRGREIALAEVDAHLHEDAGADDDAGVADDGVAHAIEEPAAHDHSVAGAVVTGPSGPRSSLPASPSVS